MKTVNFLGYECYYKFGKYLNGRTAIELVDIEGDTVAIASVNVPNTPMKPDEVAIKNYSENEGILEVLIEAGIVAKPHSQAKSGWVSVPICKLLIQPTNEQKI